MQSTCERCGRRLCETVIRMDGKRYCENCNEVLSYETKPVTNLIEAIRPGDRVTILIPNGIGRDGVEYKESTGRAVMQGSHGWVLNMGGRYGTPGIATEENTTRVVKGRNGGNELG